MSVSKDYSTLPAALTEVAGLDVERGLAMVRGKPARYLELLQYFVEEHAEDMELVTKNLADNVMAEAIRIAHNLKGTAATIGAPRMSEVARRLEMKLRDTKDLPPAPDALQPEMEAIELEFALIACSLPQPVAVPDAPCSVAETIPPDPQRLNEILDALESQLGEGDFEACDLFHKHAALLHASLGSGFACVAAAIGQLDFKSAQDRLRALRLSGNRDSPP